MATGGMIACVCAPPQAQEVGECNMKIGLLEKKLETADAEVG